MGSLPVPIDVCRFQDTEMLTPCLKTLFVLNERGHLHSRTSVTPRGRIDLWAVCNKKTVASSGRERVHLLSHPFPMCPRGPLMPLSGGLDLRFKVNMANQR